MTKLEASEIIYQLQPTFTIEDSGFGDGSFIVTLDQTFTNKVSAENFVEAMKRLSQD